MAIKLYGVPESRAARCLWMLEELGVDYELVHVNFIGDAQKPEYLKINPNGRIPAIDDDGLVLFESMAINLHLARKYDRDGSLWPRLPDDQSRSIQWSVWAMTEVQEPIGKILLNRLFLPEPQRIEAVAVEGERELKKVLGVLEGVLKGRPYLLGGAFSVADLNVYCAVDWEHPALRSPYMDELAPQAAARICQLNHDDTPNVAEWKKRCGARPALARVLAMR